MRSYIKYLSIFTPLAILLSLPCATKRQLKDNVGIPKTEIAANKGENTKFCTSIFVEKDQIKYAFKRLILDTPTISPTSNVFPVFSAIKRTINWKSCNDQRSVIPFFLLYRKLIIYF